MKEKALLQGFSHPSAKCSVYSYRVGMNASLGGKKLVEAIQNQQKHGKQGYYF